MTQYLRDLAERLMAVPTRYGVDQADIDTLLKIANRVDRLTSEIEKLGRFAREVEQEQ